MAKLSTYRQRDYSGGLNDTADPAEIKRNEASLLRNWDITYQGQLTRRLGLTQVGGDNDIGATAITGLGAYLRDGGKDVLAFSDDTLYYLNSSTWTALDDGFTAGDLWFENVQVEGKIYMGNEDNTIHHWDRGVTTLNSALTDLGATVPHGNVMRWHKNHMFTLNNATVSGTAYPHRIYWSAMGDPETWDTTNDFFEVPGAGRNITMIDAGDYLVIFKERAVQFLEGWGDTSWRVTASASNVANIDEQVGCIAPRGVTRVGDEVWFIDNEGQIRRLYRNTNDAFRRDIISTKIQGTLASVNKAQLEKAIAWTHGDKVYFAFPSGASTTNDLVCVYDLIASKRTGEEAWTTYTGWSPGCVLLYPTSVVPDLYIGSASTDGLIWTHEGEDDDGTAIDARWDGRDDSYDEDEKYKRFKFGYVTAEATSGSASIGIYSSVDRGPFANLATVDPMSTGSKLGPTGSFLLGPTGGATLGGASTAEQKFYYTGGGGSARGKSLMHSLRHNETGVQPSVNGFTSHFKIRTLR